MAEFFGIVTIIYGILIFISIIVLIWLISGLKILMEYERLIIFRLGKYKRTVGPGVVYVLPIFEKSMRVDMRIITEDIPRQEVITKDNIPVNANTVVYFSISKPEYAIVKIQNYRFAVRTYTQTAMRDVIGNMELDSVLTERERISQEIRKIVDSEIKEWGVEIKGIKLQEIELPADMKRAMAKQAEAERIKRAAMIESEGELNAAKNLQAAAALMSTDPGALQLRTLQTIRDISQNPSQKIVIFMPSGFEKILNKL